MIMPVFCALTFRHATTVRKAEKEKPIPFISRHREISIAALRMERTGLPQRIKPRNNA
jgi:hypothetical protein